MFVTVEKFEDLPDKVVYGLIFNDTVCKSCGELGTNYMMTTQGEILCSNCVDEKELLTLTVSKIPSAETKEEKIIRLHKEGYSTRSIAQEIRMSQSGVQYQLDKLNKSE